MKSKYLPYLKNKTIAVPYNNDPILIKKLNELMPKFRFFNVYIYFAPNPFITSTGRRMPGYTNFIDKDKKFQSKKFDQMLIKAMKEAKKYGFNTNLLLNNILCGMAHDNKTLINDVKKYQNYLEKLYKTGYLDKITIGNPYLLELINWKRLKNLKIKTSVNFQIKDAKTIEMLNILCDNWIDKNRLTTIEIQKDLLRDLKTLKKIKKTIKNKIKLSIIINEGCIASCPYQLTHQVHAFTTPMETLPIFNRNFKFSIAKCKYITSSAPWKIFDSNWILPKHLKYYKNLIDEFKLTDRNDSTKTILNTVKAYTT
ncbi:hypothetical protein KKB43_00675, partial [Patescibacteria group bacterium]|nr:hypothetical protein [Patescibacteria group bacterium]